MKHVILIVNPVSGKLKGKAALFGVIEALSANDVVPTVLLTKGRGDAIRLAREAAGLHAEGRCDAILCCGGDGTLNEVITGIMQSKPNIPIAGANSEPPVETSTSKKPIMGPVHENDTSDKVNAIIAPVMIPGIISGSSTLKNALIGGQPRSIAASGRLWSIC